MSTDVPSDRDARADKWLDELRREWRPRLDIPIEMDEEGVVAHTFAGDQVHGAVLRALGLEGRTEGPTLHLFAAADDVRSRASHALADLDQTLDTEAARLAVVMPVAHRPLSAPAVLVAEAREFEVDAAGIESVLTLLATWRS
jgi:hypothetical protein